jgi:hypothetical protein
VYTYLRLAWKDDPHHLYAGLVILLDLFRYFVGGVGEADDLNSKHRDDSPGPRRRDAPIARPALEQIKGDLWPPLSVDVRAEVENHLDQSAADRILINVAGKLHVHQSGQPILVHTHRLLHDAAVDNFKETIGLALAWRNVEPLGRHRGHGLPPLAEDEIIGRDSSIKFA